MKIANVNSETKVPRIERMLKRKEPKYADDNDNEDDSMEKEKSTSSSNNYGKMATPRSTTSSIIVMADQALRRTTIGWHTRLYGTRNFTWGTA